MSGGGPGRAVKRLLAALVALAALLVPALAAQGAVGDVALVSRADGPAGAAADGDSGPGIAVSASGRYIAFESSAANLTAEGDDSVTNIYLRDTETGATTLVSRADGAAGAAASDDSRAPAISPAGRWVAFESGADNLSAEDDDTVTNVFLRDTHSNRTILVSRASDGTAANGDSRDPSVSAFADPLSAPFSGAVAFESEADNLSAEDDDAVTNVFVRSVRDGTTALVSRASGRTGAGGDGPSVDPSISRDGVKVAFASDANSLTTVDDDSVRNVYVYDRRFGGFLTHESRTTVSGFLSDPADGDSFEPAISGNGRYLAFTSYARNLVAEPIQTPQVADVFVRDVQGKETTLMSRATGRDGAPAFASSSSPSISADGRLVTFVSEAGNLSDEDVAGFDVFVRSGLLTTATTISYDTTTLVSRASGAAGPAADGDSTAAAISALGGTIALVSDANNLSDADDDAFRNVHARTVRFAATPPPPPDLGDNDHGGHGGDGGAHGGHSAGTGGAHAGHDAGAPSQTLIGPPLQALGRLFVLVTVHEAGTLVVRASVRVRNGRASRLYRFRTVSRKVPAHRTNRIRLRLSRSALRAVKRALVRGKRLMVAVETRATDESGNVGRARMKVRLRP